MYYFKKTQIMKFMIFRQIFNIGHGHVIVCLQSTVLSAPFSSAYLYTLQT